MEESERVTFRDVLEDCLWFWFRALKMAFWRFDEHQTVAERLYAFLVPIVIAASPALAVLPSIPVWLALVPLMLFSLVWAPYLLWRHEHQNTTRLEKRLRPTLSMVPTVRKVNRNVLVASIRVTNDALVRVERCSGQILAATRRRGDERPQDLDWSAYVRWSTGDTEAKFNTFQSQATLDVVKLQHPYLGTSFICTVTNDGPYLNMPVVEDFEYAFTIEVSADNCAPVRHQFRFWVEPKGQHSIKNGIGGFSEASLPTVWFRQIE